MIPQNSYLYPLFIKLAEEPCQGKCITVCQLPISLVSLVRKHKNTKGQKDTQTHSCLTFLLILSLGLNSWQDVEYSSLEAGAIQLRHCPHCMLWEHEGDGGKALGLACVLADGQCDICDLS